MYVERDKEFDLLYISFKDRLKAGEVAETKEFMPGGYFDLDANGKLIGIEIVNSSNVLGIRASDLNLSGELLGVKEAAALTGKDRANFLRDLASQPDFPTPVARVASGQLWLSKDIERYVRDRERSDSSLAQPPQETETESESLDNEDKLLDREVYEAPGTEDDDHAFYPSCAEDKIQIDEEGHNAQSA